MHLCFNTLHRSDVHVYLVIVIIWKQILIRHGLYLIITFLLSISRLKHCTDDCICVWYRAHMNIRRVLLPRILANFSHERASYSHHTWWHLSRATIVISSVWATWQRRAICDEWTVRVTTVSYRIVVCTSASDPTSVKTRVTLLCIENWLEALHIIHCEYCSEEK